MDQLQYYLLLSLQFYSQHSGRIRLDYHPQSGLILTYIPAEFPLNPAQGDAYAMNATNLRLLHRRATHILPDCIKQIAELVDGLEIEKSRRDELRCEVYVKTNQKRLLFYPSEQSINMPMELIAIDLWEPAQVKTIGGKLYVMLFVDAGSVKKFLELLEDRTAEQILGHLENFRVMGERQTGRKLKQIQTDNISEFRSHLWKEWFVKNSIIHEFTAPYSSVSNSMVKRGIGMVTATTRALLIDSGLGPEWWDEAMGVAVYTGNLFPLS